MQRINLTTALGTSLVNTLFVLDEPSIGLHPRDMGRVIDVMQRLRDAGNSLVVVEHDPQIMFAADRILDLGPGPGERGGRIVFFGTPDELKRANTLTADYLSGRKRADSGIAPVPPERGGPRIELLGAAEHNLKDIDVAIPLNRLVCVTGVSGSGKSTLVQDVLHAALRKAKGKPTETPGAHRELRGADLVDDVVLVDQSPIGKTTRSNPASYVGAFDAIRKRFADAPLAKERGYTPGTFSFNAGNGRCPTCGGNGFEHVEMQFLSDVYLRCPDCDGKRFRPEVLEVKYKGRSIADVLELTVSEALAFFAGEADVATVLAPLAEVGLEYLRLGQPVPTLSGGEAQRLKLAGHLAEAAAAPRAPKGALFLFDEPTTGLHFDDIAKLLRAFRRLIAAGHSLVVIEHNLDVIRAADWIIDLGPEGGEAGGEVVCAGTPRDVMAHARSHTGRALREYAAALEMAPAAPVAREPAVGTPLQAALRERARRSILVHNAREHNLKNIDVAIPRDRFTVITGVSGSGKITLAFDILFAEGQRRYLESLNAYARQFVQPASRPDVDAIFGIPPTVAIEQRTSRGGRKSTVATLTEVYHFLRLLFVKLGTQHCPDCDVPIEPQSADAIAAQILRDYPRPRGSACSRRSSSPARATTPTSRSGPRQGLHAPARRRRVPADRDMAAARPLQGAHHRAAGRRHRRGAERERELREALARALDFGKGVVHVLEGLDRLQAAAGKATGDRVELDLPLKVFSTKRACPSCGRSFPELDPRLFSFNSKHGWCRHVLRHRAQALAASTPSRPARRSGGTNGGRAMPKPCPACEGKRLNPEALAVRFRDRSIADLTRAGGDEGRRASSASSRSKAARPRSRATSSPSSPRGSASSIEVGLLLSRARPLGADALRRRGAAHPARRAARLEPAGRLLHPRRADDRPASARQPRSCSTRWRSSRRRATRWSSSSTTRRRSGARSTSSTSAPAPASAAATWSPKATPRR